jgi:hypothetical protein
MSNAHDVAQRRAIREYKSFTNRQLVLYQPYPSVFAHISFSNSCASSASLFPIPLAFSSPTYPITLIFCPTSNLPSFPIFYTISTKH